MNTEGKIHLDAAIKLRDAAIKWHKTDKTLRYGQYLINENIIPGPNPSLFYCEHFDIAYNMAFNILINETE